jgi:hypothetical protein
VLLLLPLPGLLLLLYELSLQPLRQLLPLLLQQLLM